jgi:hypothetical protein
VTVHGCDEVVISAEEFRRLKGDLTGEALIAAMQAFAHRDVEIEPRRAPMPVREIPCDGNPISSSRPRRSITGSPFVSRDVSGYQRARASVFNPWVDALPASVP